MIPVMSGIKVKWDDDTSLHNHSPSLVPPLFSLCMDNSETIDTPSSFSSTGTTTVLFAALLAIPLIYLYTSSRTPRTSTEVMVCTFKTAVSRATT